MSEGTLLSARRRKTTRRRRRGLSEGLSAMIGTKGAEAGSSVLSGFAGGYASGFVTNLVTGGTPNKMTEGILNIGGALALAYFGMPNVGAGVVGAYAERVRVRMQTMSEGYDYAHDTALDEDTTLPVFVDENGTTMLSDENGNFFYLEETAPQFLAEEIAPQYLAENVLPGYIPGSY